jgi:predicted transcriptional regulator
MTKAQTYAWIFLSISEELTSLREITSMADAINHAVPTHKELQISFNWLEQQGLIERMGKKYRLTEFGSKVREGDLAGTIMGSWTNTTERFLRLIQESWS